MRRTTVYVAAEHECEGRVGISSQRLCRRGVNTSPDVQPDLTVTAARLAEFVDASNLITKPRLIHDQTLTIGVHLDNRTKVHVPTLDGAPLTGKHTPEALGYGTRCQKI